MTQQTAAAAPATSRVNDVMEWAGLACLVAFAYFVWPPLALAAAGLVLVVVANLRDMRRRQGGRVPVSEKLARALAAWRAAGASGGR